ncbi:TonB-linked SusC/RagA family outer membrane protein [Catalinimonas alkaloidigena]|uniref:SusC/RagA family TonB-linked outer membrane protein n=1 Tax=Catalinimonas alkaloidigena TaxID=1075417 RepID=UPI0024062B40|nr:TonB-dependent receptor [Catalinimonas alkaloidigena]MDF9799347.1 TonB-linked SusC/RagA family outer membrane protein [Catalinimonas alkaloidigena]
MIHLITRGARGKLHLLGMMILLCLLIFEGGFVQAQDSQANPNELSVTRVFAFAPEQGKKQELKLVLKELEHEYEVRFYFDPTLLEGKIANAQLGKEGLETKLSSLLTPLELVFKKIDDASYVIRQKKEESILPKMKTKEPGNSEVLESIGRKRLSMLKSLKVMEQTISGKVEDGESGEPLPGVNVLAKGTTSGTVTDIEGNYRLTVGDDVTTLVFSSIGYVSKEEEINGRTTISISLLPDVQSLDEIVVVGYGTQQKSDMTGSVGSVDKEVFQKLSPTNLQQGLAGRVSGVNVTQNSGRPGGRPTIRIRGNSSITGSNDPLYVIDGVILPVTNLSNGTSPIDFLDPGNIESVEVLKDASATAIYGARAANGVVLVTTKSANRSASRLSYDGSFSVGTLRSKVDLLNAKEFLMVEDIAYQNAEKYGLGASAVDPATKRTDPRLFDAAGNPLYDTDWQEEGFRTAISNSHNLSYSGGDETNTFAVSLGYRNQEGILLTSSLERFSGRLMVDTQIKEWLTTGASINYSVQNESQPRAVGAGGITPTRSILQALPITPVRYPDGSFGRTLDYPGMEGGAQPVRLVNETKRLLNGVNTVGNAYTNIRLADGLELRSTVGISLIDQEVNYYAGHDLQFISENGVASTSDERHTSWQFENYLTYTTTLAEKHALTGLLGTSWQRVNTFSTSASAENFIDDYFEFNNLGIASNPRPPASNASGYSLNSYFARLNYTLDSKYLFTLTGRMDGSSRFSQDNQYAFFPSGAIGWRISEENFMQSVSFISNLKLRSSYGITGNSEIPNYRTVAGLGNYAYIINGERVSGIGLDRMANPDLKWEKNSQFDFGIEVGLFNGRISFEGDIYYKRADDMLLNAPVPATSAYSTVIRNIGSMENRGVEFALRTSNIVKNDFSWSTSFNISMNRNKVLHLTGGQDIVQGGNPVTGNRIIREGEPINSFYGFVQLGTWNTDQADEAATYNRLPGDIRYQDMNDDGAINEQDRVIIGNGLPDGYGALINTLNYKNLELMLDIQFMYGNDVSYGTKATSQDRTGITNVFSDVLNAWTPENQDTFVPEIRPTAAYRDRQTSTGRIYDGSFIRGRNLMLAYSVPSNTINRWGLSSVRVQASLQNFFVITDYPGYDPEVSSLTENFAQGVDLYSYPKPRVFQLGLNIGL